MQAATQRFPHINYTLVGAKPYVPMRTADNNHPMPRAQNKTWCNETVPKHNKECCEYGIACITENFTSTGKLLGATSRANCEKQPMDANSPGCKHRVGRTGVAGRVVERTGAVGMRAPTRVIRYDASTDCDNDGPVPTANTWLSSTMKSHSRHAIVKGTT